MKWLSSRRVTEGTWTYWHPNGRYMQAYTYEAGKKNGDYTWDDANGDPRARGRYTDDNFDGGWVWHHEQGYERVERGYRCGSRHGEHVSWYPGGQLGLRCTHNIKYKHGLEERFTAEGTPSFRGEWWYGVPRGEHTTLDAEGTQNTRTYKAGIDVQTLNKLSEKKIASLLKKLAKARDHYAKRDALEAVVEYSEKAALVFKLWKDDLYDVPGDRELWEAMNGGRHPLNYRVSFRSARRMARDL